MPMRPLIYYIATTLDGYIAHPDGSFDGFSWDEEFIAGLFASFPETLPVHIRGEAAREDNKWFDTVLMGRKTYELGVQAGVTSPYPTLDQFVISRSMKESLDPAVTLVKDGVEHLVRELKEDEGKAIWLCGGGELAGTLMRAGLIDQLIIKLNPVVFGDGIPLFTGKVDMTQFKLTDSQVFGSGQVILYYEVA